MTTAMVTDDQVKAALNDRQALVLTLWGEARGEGERGLIAVGCVIRNRVWAGAYGGTTYRAVCLARRQFTCWWPAPGAERNYRAVMGLARALLAPVPVALPESVQAYIRVADGLLSGAIEDVLAGATHYLTRECYQRTPPAWTAAMRVTQEVGGHVFLAAA